MIASSPNGTFVIFSSLNTKKRYKSRKLTNDYGFKNGLFKSWKRKPGGNKVEKQKLPYKIEDFILLIFTSFKIREYILAKDVRWSPENNGISLKNSSKQLQLYNNNETT